MFKHVLLIAIVFLVSCNQAERNTGNIHKELTIDINTSWVDTLNNRVNDYSVNIYDPDKFLKETLNDTVKLLHYKRLSEVSTNLKALSYALNMLGKNRLNSSDYLMAIQYHKQAYDVALTANDNYLEALSLNMMGVVYRRKSAVKTALEYYTRALKAAEESNIKEDYMLKSIAISNEGIGGLYRLLGQYEQAIVYYKNSLWYEEQLGSMLGMAINNHNIGKSYNYLSKYDSALYYHKKSLEYNNEMNSIYGKAICFTSIGEVYMRQNKTDSAYKLFVPALKMALISGDSTYIVNSNLNLGQYHLANKSLDSSGFYIKKALAISKRIGYKDALRKGNELLSNLYSIAGEDSEALKYFKIADAYKDSIINEKNQQYLVDLTLLYDIEKKKQTIEKLQLKAQVNEKVQQSKNLFIGLLGMLAIILFALIFQKLQAMKKNKLIHNQKEELFNMQLELKVLQNERLIAENKQKESEKEMLKEKLSANELARKNEKLAMQKEIDHKNRELAMAAAYTIQKSESIRKVLDSIEKFRSHESDVKSALQKLQKEIEYQLNTNSDWENFSLHFESVHPEFFKNLKFKHPGITPNELRLCAYVLMNLSNKEIALLLYISNDAVQKAKYRLKKKFMLPIEERLFDYLLSI